jgi:septum formation protein
MQTELLDKYRIILASGSPRRRQLLSELGLKFETAVRVFDESYPPDLDGRSIAGYISAQKAASFRAELAANDIVITADTIVWCNGRVLGKPADREAAIWMIRELSGNSHEVITGVTILSNSRERTFSVSTRVTFDPLSGEEIEYYVDKFRPFDKAGAYGIQEWIGLAACSSIEGSYFNVVGLPVRTLYRELIEFASKSLSDSN